MQVDEEQRDRERGDDRAPALCHGEGEQRRDAQGGDRQQSFWHARKAKRR